MTRAELLAHLQAEAKRQGQGYCVAAWQIEDEIGIPRRSAAILLRALEQSGHLDCVHRGSGIPEGGGYVTASCWRPDVGFWEAA